MWRLHFERCFWVPHSCAFCKGGVFLPTVVPPAGTSSHLTAGCRNLFLRYPQVVILSAAKDLSEISDCVKIDRTDPVLNGLCECNLADEIGFFGWGAAPLCLSRVRLWLPVRMIHSVLLCFRHSINPIANPTPPVASRNGRASGIAIHASITSPSETIAPARVPGTDRLPKPAGCLSVFCVAKGHPLYQSRGLPWHSFARHICPVCVLDATPMPKGGLPASSPVTASGPSFWPFIRTSRRRSNTIK
jgi:hypothetical protein